MSEDTKEMSLEAKLRLIREQFESLFNRERDELMRSAVPYVWVSDIFDAFIIVNVEGRLFRVNYVILESGAAVFSSLMEWVEVEIGYNPKGFTALGTGYKAPSGEVTIKSVGKPSLINKLKAASSALGELLGFVSDNKSKPIGCTIKAADGELWHVAWATNAFQDREREIFAVKALERFIAENAVNESKGTFDFWHIPGTDFAEKKLQVGIGRFLFEAGPYLDTDIGQAAKSFFEQHPSGHPDIAPEGWGSSPEYRYLPEERSSGVYDWIWITRTSTLPKSAAANIWTQSGLQEVNKMQLTPEQLKAMETVFGSDRAKQIMSDGNQKTADLEAAGVATKSADEGVPAATDTVTAENALATEAPAPTEDEQPQAEPPIDPAALAAEISKHFKADMEPLQQVLEGTVAGVKALTDELAAIKARLDKFEQLEAMKAQAELPRNIYQAIKRASEAAGTVVPETSALKESKPQQTPTDESPGARVTNALFQKRS